MKTEVSRETIYHETSFCVVGGGLAGLSAAVAAARKGTRTILVQDRPMLGGNASSEVRMWVRGAHGENNKETGIISEIELENIYRNPDLNFSLWDSVMYGAAIREPKLTLMLNTTCIDARSSGGVIDSITCWQMTTYTFHTIKADIFADCSGDSVLAPYVGAKWTKGREARGEYGESIAPEEADLKTMGLSCLLQARETDKKVDFIKPEWAYTYESDEDMPRRDHDLAASHTNFWWLELGGESDSLRDAENIRDELLKTALGAWDHIKNHGSHGADNWAIEWIGFLPGKRESRRYVGAHVLTQNDIRAEGRFEDIVAYGGWSMDDHNPGGFAYPGEPTIYHSAPSPYGIPFRCLYSANVKNLMFAGRNISATHSALSSTRVMATCAIMGQAVGNAAHLCDKFSCYPSDVGEKHIPLLQREILHDGCYIPWRSREIPSCVLESASNLTEEEKSELFSGVERPQGEKRNYVSRETGGFIEYKFKTPVSGTVRLVLDLDFSRKSVSDDPQKRLYAMRCNVPIAAKSMKMPANLAKNLIISAVSEDGSEMTLFSSENNYKHIIFAKTPTKIISLRASFNGAWQSGESRIFSFDLEEEFN